jgi:UDP-N-acetylmuramoyl-L-alanyl-D-glutamate--2,6-diaminopimelate ligase
LADEIFITDDNPRFEDANIIREEIIASCPKGINIPDRAVAIAQAIASLKSGDVLVIAGKGHETGQYIQGNIIPFSDHEEVIKNLS